LAIFIRISPHLPRTGNCYREFGWLPSNGCRYWDDWKNGQFNDLNVEEMETVAGGYSKRVAKLRRDIKKWKVWEAMKLELDSF